MTADPLGPLFEDRHAADFDDVLSQIRREISDLNTVIPGALARQWEASPVPKPREDTSQRAQGERSNPTADIVLDSRRLAVRESVTKAERVLGEVLRALQRIRAEMDRAVYRFDGEAG